MSLWNAGWRSAVTAAADLQRTPFFLLRSTEFVRFASLVHDAISTAAHGKRVRDWYSYKTLPVPHFAQLAVAELNMGVEVTSEFELHSVRSLGVGSEQTLLSGPLKQMWAEQCTDKYVVSFDSIREIRELAQTASRYDWTVGLRIATSVERDPDDPNYPSQFGIGIAQLEEAGSILSEAGLGRPCFVHFHLRSNVEPENLIAAARQSAVGLRGTNMRDHFRVIDVGGGLPELGVGITADEPEWRRRLSLHAEAVHQCAESFGEVNEIWVENGRSIVGPAGALVVTVRDVKEREGLRILICDGGRTNHALESDWATHTVIAIDSQAGAEELDTVVCGPSCMAFDWLARAKLPANIEVGSLLVYLNAGAYHLPWETRFSRGLCAVVMEDLDGRLSVIREAESTVAYSEVWQFRRNDGLS